MNWRNQTDTYARFPFLALRFIASNKMRKVDDCSFIGELLSIMDDIWNELVVSAGAHFIKLNPLLQPAVVDVEDNTLEVPARIVEIICDNVWMS